MKQKYDLPIILLVLAISFICAAFSQKAHADCPIIKTCFTPQQNCTAVVKNEISNAKKSVLVQAYSFTSEEIANALIDAKKRGLLVDVLLDKSNFKENKATGEIKRKSIPRLFLANGMLVYSDLKPAIAHNKIIIIDGTEVITGSFNFTNAAQQRNAENLVIISSPEVAKKYVDNFYYRRAKSDQIRIVNKCSQGACHDEFFDMNY